MNNNINPKKLYTKQLITSNENYIKYQFEVYINSYITYNRNGIISIVIIKYEFNGGAHGMTYLNNYNYNLCVC